MRTTSCTTLTQLNNETADIQLRTIDSQRFPMPQPIELARLGVMAWSSVRLSFEELAELRRQPDSRFPVEVSPLFLKHSDEQTIASLAAVQLAKTQFDLTTIDFDRWGIITAPRFFGRTAMAATMHRFQIDGPWGASVQVVPHRSQHSVSSTISLAIKSHGPCIGVGGGLNSEADALLASATLLYADKLPGVWMVFSGWDPELAIDATGKPMTESSCLAIAFALVADTAKTLPGTICIRHAQKPADSSTSSEIPFLLSCSTALNSFSLIKAKHMRLFGLIQGRLAWNLDLRRTKTFATSITKDTLPINPAFATELAKA